eukprot:CAMPEP_0177757668 /NCGR_PEP_ID=MMETSP0491_2-20121128/3765_1 /TAXON_ID=63592 /ORGANISM="Tetraselmis chuii, Strain PLY429" /LENGTH=354 /DNA_ID=CAMNT_0019273333 /DNA_START=264 /DNA_END=1328 /DNA_ORIENTATION=-
MESSAAAGDTKVASETCDDQKQHEQSVPGRSYVPWSGVEVEALRLGVQRHGVGAWQIILRDPDFEVLTCRSGIQLKDKWRNLVKFKHLSKEETEFMSCRISDQMLKKSSKPGRISSGGPEEGSFSGATGLDVASARALSGTPSPVGSSLPIASEANPNELTKRSSTSPSHDPHFLHSTNSSRQMLLSGINRTGGKAGSRAQEFNRSSKRAKPNRSFEEARQATIRAPNNDARWSPERHVGNSESPGGACADTGDASRDSMLLHHWARWSEVHMASLLELRMLLTESLQLQAEADNALLETVTHVRCGTKPVDEVHHALHTCDMASQKVQLTSELMDDWRRKVCVDCGPSIPYTP